MGSKMIMKWTYLQDIEKTGISLLGGWSNSFL